MWRKGLIFWIALALLAGVMQSAVAASPDLPKAVLLKGYWFGDGFLADDPRYMDWNVVAGQTIRLYESPSLTASFVGELAPGTRARINDIAFEAYPGLQQIRVTEPVASMDGRIRLEAGDALGYFIDSYCVCQCPAIY